jgi:p-aminobenzoyl-glutamate transporter AbgT
MDINDLRKAWKKMSDNAPDRKELTEDKIRELLSTRTASLMERIDRNIRIGLAVLFFTIVLIIIWDFLLIRGSGISRENQMQIPLWVTLLDRGINFLIFGLFLVFVIRYHQIRVRCKDGCNLRQALERVIKILVTYKRLFVFALVIFLLSSATGYIAGFYKGIHLQDSGGIYLPVTIALGVIPVTCPCAVHQSPFFAATLDFP